jgi:hypothetical protein
LPDLVLLLVQLADAQTRIAPTDLKLLRQKEDSLKSLPEHF